MTIKSVFENQQSPLPVVLAAAIKAFDGDIDHLAKAEPETVRLFIGRQHDAGITQLMSDKIQSGLSMLAHNNYLEDWAAFELVVNSSNHQPDDYETPNPPNAEDLAMWLADYHIIAGDTTPAPSKNRAVHYGDRVEARMGEIFHAYGYKHAPQLFPTAIMPAAEGTAEADAAKDEAMLEAYTVRFAASASALKQFRGPCGG